MQTAESNLSPACPALGRDHTLRLALVVSFLVIGLDQFLRTSPATLLASPLDQALRWVGDALLALPLAAAAIWAGHRIAGRLGIGSATVSDIFARTCLIALLLAVLLAPFVGGAADWLTGAHGSQPGHAHSHGLGAGDWAGGAVIYALTSIPFVAAVVWAGHRVTSRLGLGLGGAADVFTRASVIALLLALMLVPAWYLQQAAGLADAGQVTYTSGLLSVHPHSLFSHRHLFLLPAAPTATGASLLARTYQVARALRNGLAGQAIGLPAMFIALVWLTRGQRRRTCANRQVPKEGTG